MKRKCIVLTYEIWPIKWNIHFPTFDCTYLWWKCRDIWRNNRINSLLCPFECPYLWRNYRNKLRTRLINMSLWSKLFWNKYVRKTAYQTEQLTERAGKGIWTILKIRNSRFYENFYSKNCRMLPVFDKLFGYFCGIEKLLYNFLKT